MSLFLFRQMSSRLISAVCSRMSSCVSPWKLPSFCCRDNIWLLVEASKQMMEKRQGVKAKVRFPDVCAYEVSYVYIYNIYRYTHIQSLHKFYTGYMNTSLKYRVIIVSYNVHVPLLRCALFLFAKFTMCPALCYISGIHDFRISMTTPLQSKRLKKSLGVLEYFMGQLKAVAQF